MYAAIVDPALFWIVIIDPLGKVPEVLLYVVTIPSPNTVPYDVPVITVSLTLTTFNESFILVIISILLASCVVVIDTALFLFMLPTYVCAEQ